MKSVGGVREHLFYLQVVFLLNSALDPFLVNLIYNSFQLFSDFFL